MRYASGENFTIDIEDGVGICRLFKRPDLDHGAHARAAQHLLQCARELTRVGEVDGAVVDLRRVPGAASPEVAAHYAQILAAWEATGQRIALLVVDDDAVQKMQLHRIVQENAPRHGAVLTDRNEARRFAGATDFSGPATASVVMDRPSRMRRA